ncbi:class I SAM-dependent methyltransferase [Crocinitomix catalasitica]|uniref:class I SAM-dependent methyltransferase n=1 Tax=Crocinitomix catalasitica TaxID=184607 RepID=UPI00047FF757|nr:class I SAM-dependent methyltransferase [Crocinitomix catalasitica]
MKLDAAQLLELERQLGKPEGEFGMAVANEMNKSNYGIIHDAFERLNIKNGQNILELGHANGEHVLNLLENLQSIHYSGLEISTLMHNEAIRINEKHIRNGKAKFELYDGNLIPERDLFFDSIITVNTLYFWEKPIDLMNEIHRVLATDGFFVLAFVKKDFMQDLPFVNDGFSLYNNADVSKLVSQSKFKTAEFLDREEEVQSKDNTFVNRKYSLAIIRK